MTIVAAVHAAATLCMTGVIWFVQVVHYPQFAQVGSDRFAAYEREHVRRTGWVVGPLMLAEATTAALLAVFPPADGTRAVALAGLLLLAVVWLSTALLQVPCHRHLERGYDEGAVQRLVATNWIRTAAWTARAPVALWLVAGVAVP